MLRVKIGFKKYQTLSEAQFLQINIIYKELQTYR